MRTSYTIHPIATPATPYISIAMLVLHQLYHTSLLLHHTFLLLCRCYTSYTMHLYCYTGVTLATPYISIATRVLHQPYHIFIAMWVLHHTSLLLHGATAYISIATPATSFLLYGCYTIHLYCYTQYQYIHHTSLLLHSATPYISIATPYISIVTRGLHHTFLLLHGRRVLEMLPDPSCINGL